MEGIKSRKILFYVINLRQFKVCDTDYLKSASKRLVCSKEWNFHA